MKKIIFRTALVLFLLTGAVHLFSALTADRNIEYKEITISSPKVTAETDGYTAAFITDLHDIGGDELQAAADKLNEMSLDVLLLGGDFPSGSTALDTVMKIISGVKTADGIYGVEGNHDRYIDLFPLMESYGITPLSNSGLSVRDGIYVAGTEDMWNRNPDVRAAVSGAKPEDFTFLLAHNPDTSMTQDTAGVDLILSGHTHGGQITFFGVWAPALAPLSRITDYGQKFMGGPAESADGTPVYVSRGTGTFSHLPRVFARPEVTVIRLMR